MHNQLCSQSQNNPRRKGEYIWYPQLQSRNEHTQFDFANAPPIMALETLPIAHIAFKPG